MAERKLSIWIGATRWLVLPALVGAACVLAGCASHDQAAVAHDGRDTRPNILLIVADDLGYTDIGAFGGDDLHTPNLDALAQRGVRLSQFYAAPTCSPTRAMLFSGVDSHLAGLGEMRERMPLDGDKPEGYEGHLNTRVAALPELLQELGYDTFFAGKWHMGHEIDLGPWARGFDRSFAVMSGLHNHYGVETITPTTLWEYVGPTPVHWEDAAPVYDLPDEFYSSNYFTQKIVEYIHAERDEERPFFAMLSFTAPHWPLQAPREAIAKYEGAYDTGYEALRAARTEAMRREGLFPADAPTSPSSPNVPVWDDLTDEEQARSARAMEIYAAMVEVMDWNIGRLFRYLDRNGDLDNTLVLFMSDNGAAGLPLHLEPWASFVQRQDNALDDLGAAGSFVAYGPGWAGSGSAALSGLKSSTLEGGIRVPAIAAGPMVGEPGRVAPAVVTVRDILPSFLEAAGSDVGTVFADRPDVHHPNGASFLPMLEATGITIHEGTEVLGWETSGSKAIRKGDWKLVYTPWDERWRLYDLAEDPGEVNDLSDAEPDTFGEMMSHWREYAAANNVRE